MVCRRRERFARAFAFGLALALAIASRTGSASTDSSALELVREARVHEGARDDDLAARRYMEALSLDPTCGDAYLGLGALRARMGDLREADRVYTVGLSHVPTLSTAIVRRAQTRRALGEIERARDDLETYAFANDDAVALRELASWYSDDGLVPAQLAIWRRMHVLAQRTNDAPLAREAVTMVRALQIVVGPADPVTAPTSSVGVRRLIARIARRGG